MLAFRYLVRAPLAAHDDVERGIDGPSGRHERLQRSHVVGAQALAVVLGATGGGSAIEAGAVPARGAPKGTAVRISAANPDRDAWPLHGARQAGDRIEGVVTAGEAKPLAAPQPDEDLQRFV